MAIFRLFWLYKIFRESAAVNFFCLRFVIHVTWGFSKADFEMAIILPVIGNLFGILAPGFALGLIVFLLAFYRLRIEKLPEDRLENHVVIEPSANETCEDCQCGKEGGKCKKIKRLSILYGTTTGTAKDFAWSLAQEAEDEGLEVDVNNASNVDAEEFLPAEAGNAGSVLVVIISTYTDGTPPETAAWFYKWLEESAKDFRVQHSLLKGLKYSVFGLGNSTYSDHFNTIARNCDKFLFKLSGERFTPLCLGDEDTTSSKNGSIEEDFNVWKEKLLSVIVKRNEEGKVEELEPEVEEEMSDSDFSEEEEEQDEEENGDGLIDLEDLGSVMKKSKSSTNGDQGPKEMLTSSLRQSLTKQGYKLIGSHSGVKICRWTKAMLRGRGGCYKHTFYGIESHRCMETTPSLACANKCVFCWRHHSNPVGTEWKWAMDPPDMILDGALENHYKMIKQMKGVPGVLPERYQEGFQVRHCALSLVGEPIMYPEINK